MLLCIVVDTCFVALDVVFHYLAKRLAGKNVLEMTYFVSGGS